MEFNLKKGFEVIVILLGFSLKPLLSLKITGIDGMADIADLLVVGYFYQFDSDYQPQKSAGFKISVRVRVPYPGPIDF